MPFLYPAQGRVYFENEADYTADFADGLNRMYHELQSMHLYDGLKENTNKTFKDQFNLKDTQLDEDLKEAIFVSYIYPNGNKNLKIIDTISSENGFWGIAFQQRDQNIIIAFRGTDEIGDIKSDLQLLRQKELPEQYAKAIQFYSKIKEQNPGKRIIVTGHSLGASLAQLVGATYKESYVFACFPIGTKKIIKNNKLKDYKNIYSFVAEGDFFSAPFAHPGFVKQVKTDVMKWAHSLENCFE